jgi:hypothetical protein
MTIGLSIVSFKGFFGKYLTIDIDIDIDIDLIAIISA